MIYHKHPFISVTTYRPTSFFLTAVSIHYNRQVYLYVTLLLDMLDIRLPFFFFFTVANKAAVNILEYNFLCYRHL